MSIFNPSNGTLSGLELAKIINEIVGVYKKAIAVQNYKNYQAYGAVAGIEINEGIDPYAYKKGLFVIKPSGDTVAIINDDNFQPMTW